MNDNVDLQPYMNNPGLLAAVCRQVIDRLAAELDLGRRSAQDGELQKTLQAIAALERIGITPPAELLAKRDRLQANLPQAEHIQRTLRELLTELRAIVADLEARISSLPPRPQPRPSPRPRSRSPRTPMEVLKEQIILALQKLGGRAEAAAVVEEVGKQLEGRLTPGDLEWSEARQMYAWQHKTHWARYELTRDGVLSHNSPRGIWELAVHMRKS